MSRRLGTHKDLEKLARKCRSEGWSVAVGSSNHIVWTKPDGKVIRTGLTMSSRSVENAVRKIERELLNDSRKIEKKNVNRKKNG